MKLFKRLLTRFVMTPARFSRHLVKVECSAAHGQLCERVHGRNLCQMNMLDMEQLDRLLELLSLGPEDRVLDIGCGIGLVTEHISRVSGCTIKGIDFAAGAMARANQRVSDQERIRFETGDINRLDLPPACADAVVAIDSLYFSRNLEETVAQLERSLRPGGRMGIFHTQKARRKNRDILEAGNTDLARALTSNGLTFQVTDFTANERALWHGLLEVAEELRPVFKAEKSTDLQRMRVWEAKQMSRIAQADRLRRYLYLVTRESPRPDQGS